MYGVKLWRKRASLFGALRAADFAAGNVDSGQSRCLTDTEFSAEVVRVTRVLPHPNADRLEILRFEMKGIGETAYEVVSQKGNFKAGNHAAYFSVDCLLPTSHPHFRFLLDRLDGAGKETYRLRAARLRGVFSQGLLVPVPSPFGYGDQIADHFGVTYYRAPEPADRGANSAGKSKSGPQPFPIYAVDSLKKLPRLFEEGERVVITEKIHGTNFRFGWVPRKVFGIRFGWKFVVGSHRVIKAKGDSGYYGEDLWSQAAENMGLADLTKGYKGHTFYGELFGYTYSGQKIQDLTYERAPTRRPRLVIFDIRDDQGEWMDVWTRRNLCAELDLMHAPILSIGPELSTIEFSAEKVREMAEGPSLLAPQQIREGVVVESTLGPRRKAKYVGESYLTRKEAA